MLRSSAARKARSILFELALPPSRRPLRCAKAEFPPGSPAVAWSEGARALQVIFAPLHSVPRLLLGLFAKLMRRQRRRRSLLLVRRRWRRRRWRRRRQHRMWLRAT